MAMSRRNFPKVTKDGGIPRKYVKGSKNEAATKKEIKNTAKKYKKGTLTKAEMNRVVKQRVASGKKKPKKRKK